MYKTIDFNVIGEFYYLYTNNDKNNNVRGYLFLMSYDIATI